AIAGVARGTRPGHGGDDACGGVDFTDGGVQPVGDVDVAVGVYVQRVGLVERRPCGRPAIAGVARCPRPGYGGDRPCDLIDTAHAVVRCLCHVEMTMRVKGTHERLAEQRLDGWATVARVALDPGASDGLDDVKRKCHRFLHYQRFWRPLPGGEGRGEGRCAPCAHTVAPKGTSGSWDKAPHPNPLPEGEGTRQSTPSCSVALTPAGTGRCPPPP